MKKSSYLLLAVVVVLYGCRPELKLTYGENGVVFPGSGTVKPTFTGGEAKGSFSAYPSTLAIDATTGEINVDAKSTVPGYRYLVRFVSADGRRMAHTFVTVAGIRYPSRYFDVTNPADVTARPLLTDSTLEVAEGQFAVTNYRISDVVPATTVSPQRQQVPIDTAGAVQQLLNARNGALNLQQLVQTVFGSARSGKIELTIQYQTSLNGRNVSGQTQYILLRQVIESAEYRTMLRDWMNFDKVIEARQNELILEKNAANIRIQKSWGLGYTAPEQNSVFRFVGALQDAPPPSGRGGI